MSLEAEERTVDVVSDNDVIFKAVCYGFTGVFWPNLGRQGRVAVLGAARYVLPREIDRARLTRDKKDVHAALVAFLESANLLEPTEAELALAAHIEAVAQQEGLQLDTGESQLAAITVQRAIAALETGDKRAVRSLERLLDHLGEALYPLSGRVRCLEQLVLGLVLEGNEFEAIATAICTEPGVDRTMTICFGCYSESRTPREGVLLGLRSYIDDLRRNARRVLAP